MLGILLLLEYTLLALFVTCFGLRRLASCFKYYRGTLYREDPEFSVFDSAWIWGTSFRGLFLWGFVATALGLLSIPGLLYLAQYLREPLPLAWTAPYLHYVRTAAILGLSAMAAGTVMMFTNIRMRVGFRVVLLGALLLIPVTLLTAPLR